MWVRGALMAPSQRSTPKELQHGGRAQRRRLDRHWSTMEAKHQTLGHRMKTLAIINSDGKRRAPLDDPPGVRSVLLDLELRVLARTPYEHLLTELSTVATAERAVALAHDAIFIDTFGDYGLERIRAIAEVPVVGAGEASIGVAAEQVGRYSIITVWPESMRYLYEERLRTCAGGEACVGVHHLSDEDELDRIGQEDSARAEMRRRDSTVIDRLAELCEQAVASDESAGVLLGCTCMSPIADDLARRLPFPVVDPSTIGNAAALAALDGPTPKRGSASSRQAGMASAVVAAYLASVGKGEVVLEECEVCMVADA